MTARRLQRPPVFVVLILLFVMYFVMIMISMPQIEKSNEFVFPPPEVKVKDKKPTRLNVILLSHMSSGSTVMGKLLNYHPDVFYIYEPLNGLRRAMGTNEWRALDESKNDELRKGVWTLLPDLFSCRFQQEQTVKLVFPNWIRSYNAWDNPSTPLTNDSLRQLCNARITVTKIMQTRLPGKVGIRELQRVCSSDPEAFDCMIIHLVRDPRAVLSSLIPRRFFIMDEPEVSLFKKSLMSPEGMSFLKQSVQTLCSTVTENLRHVKREWSNWFKDRYLLVRYEDAISDMSEIVRKMYKFIGLHMPNSNSKCSKGCYSIPGQKKSFFVWTSSIDNWRFKVNSTLVSMFEEVCAPLMEAMGYIFANGSVQLQYDKSNILRTAQADIPFIKELHSAMKNN